MSQLRASEANLRHWRISTPKVLLLIVPSSPQNAKTSTPLNHRVPFRRFGGARPGTNGPDPEFAVRGVGQFQSGFICTRRRQGLFQGQRWRPRVRAVGDGWNTAGTTMVADIYPGGGDSNAFMIGGIGPVAIFTAYDGSGSAFLWRSDGTPSGTIKLFTFPSGSYTISGVATGSRVFVFMASNSDPTTQILETDGTTAGTQIIGAYPVIYGSSSIGVNDNLYFVAQDATVGTQLFVSDGTVVGTHMVRRNVECPGSSCGPVPKTFFRIGDNVLFVTSDGLWKTDGTGPGTQLLASIPNPTVLATSPSAPAA